MVVWAMAALGCARLRAPAVCCWAPEWRPWPRGLDRFSPVPQGPAARAPQPGPSQLITQRAQNLEGGAAGALAVQSPHGCMADQGFERETIRPTPTDRSVQLYYFFRFRPAGRVGLAKQGFEREKKTFFLADDTLIYFA